MPHADAPALSTAGRTVRLAALGVVAVLTLLGTVSGTDSDFPFGPFRMYASRDDPNGVVAVAAVQAIGPDAHLTDLTNAGGAPRRAEIEGRMAQLRGDCTTFARLIPRYHPGPGTTSVRLIEREYHLRDGRRDGRTDVVVCSVPWTAR